ncbi:outer membrane protein assembly factor BamB family protein [Botrimarina hoheduenensis]|uniref:Outer membrane biogenesis protein BamB n=1 Tax=Botrimarina hoheduenensis TaxID=2528000 RepID=A0A5C5W947_9BACT|nr:PQQ-binding-like beta-propeller repeat protein [Botrimarina hoheduenensis]TWT47406.1 outer membrane biogenesis protein BamB [Botrimarina hoheduenensis]
MTALLATPLLTNLFFVTASAAAGDWPMWRGPHGDSTVEASGLIDSWSPPSADGTKPGENVLWRRPELAGRSTPVVLAGKLYTLVRDQPGTATEGEKVVCVNAATGEPLWEHRCNVYLSDVPDTRVGWSSVVADPASGRVYAQSVSGYFCCLDGATGRLVWERSLHEELGFLSTYGGRTNFPLIYGDTVITSAVVIGWGDTPKWNLMAKPAHRFMAFDSANGELRWLSATQLIPDDTTYSTPHLTRLADQDVLVFGSGDGAVWAMQAGTGRPLWKYQLSRRGLNVSPVVGSDGMVYMGHSEENMVGSAMGAMIAIDGVDALPQGKAPPTDVTDREVWKNYQMMVGKSSPLLIESRVYAINDSAKLLVLDAKTGKEITRKPLGRVMRSSPIYADGKIYTCSQEGRWWVLKPTKKGVDVVHSLVLRGEESDASPIVADGCVYLTTSEAMYCLGKASTPSQAAPPETPAITEPADQRVAQVQLSPWDVLLTPGSKQQYTVRLYNAAGQLLRVADTSKVTFGVAGAGNINAQGEYTAPKSVGHQAARILCDVEGMASEARVRLSPPLPWSFDFEDGEEPPLTWVGGRVRYVPRTGEDGSHYLAKPTELPTKPGAPTTKLGTRSQMWMGSAELSNYTVRADIQLQEGVGGEASSGRRPEGPPAIASAVKLPSAGLINSGYTFTLFGPNQEARLYSWCTHDKRTQATLPMKLEAGVWYHLKLSVTPKHKKGVALVRAKVWAGDDAEPDAWSLQFEDPAPNYHGSPGLFGDSKEAEFYVDNLRVTPNE